MKKEKITIKNIFEDNFKEFWMQNDKKFPEEEREHILGSKYKSAKIPKFPNVG